MLATVNIAIKDLISDFLCLSSYLHVSLPGLTQLLTLNTLLSPNGKLTVSPLLALS